MRVQELKYPSYGKLGMRWRRPARGFRLSPSRLSVRRLRVKLWTLLGLLGRYARNVRLLTRGLVAGSSSPTSTSAGGGGGGRTALVVAKNGGTAGSNIKARRPPCMRSNSFYARAVAECLDFIKGSNATPAEETRTAAAPLPLAAATAS